MFYLSTIAQTRLDGLHGAAVVGQCCSSVTIKYDPGGPVEYHWQKIIWGLYYEGRFYWLFLCVHR